ncbi:nuclease-related domain-containing protein [Geomesophilobacter sediminis]|uniref:NERD domain-containing protein n=1 Tax=Geomesophilobacter sediminis TaxID=2798584 RepID=A0A8J7SA74_9BACT|nr:nuclease-related domain-containing protein [Geomesophilobacter sediminis]MBJ6727206.1 NERD domain-containing protein [Geomesophilobacter sediminis]
MIIKKADERQTDLQELRNLLQCRLSAKQRVLIEREIKWLSSGIRGEENSAYYIDFYYQDSERWAVIHDLRLQHNGFLAQIDHLLISRFLDIYVLETKNYSYGVKITPEGEFMLHYGNSWTGIESPIEQNRRHIHLLEKVLADRNLLPTRLGIPMPAALHNYVLISPKATITRPSGTKFEMVIKADALKDTIGKRVDAMGVASTLATAGKYVSRDTLESFANALVRLHRPGKINYAEKFGVTVDQLETAGQTDSPKEGSEPSKGNGTCEACGLEVESKVMYFCRMNKARFAGKILCQSCQKKPLPTREPEIIELTDVAETSEESGGGNCEKCGSPVDKKVAYFCRINKKRFAGRLLCRSCQST